MIFIFKKIILGESSQSGLSSGADRDGRMLNDQLS